LLETNKVDYGQEALDYYQRCSSFLPHLYGLSEEERMQAKVLWRSRCPLLTCFLHLRLSCLLMR
jgi:hypothetical protein